MKITSSVEYATRIMVRLADLKGGATLSAEFLSESENIPRDYVDQILLRLRRAQLVVSRRGVHGGYHLAKAPGEIAIGQVVRAVDKGIFESVCDRYAQGEHKCAHTSGCGIRPIWQRLGVLVEGFLANVTLAQLREDEACVDSRVAFLFSGSGGGVSETRIRSKGL